MSLCLCRSGNYMRATSRAKRLKRKKELVTIPWIQFQHLRQLRPQWDRRRIPQSRPGLVREGPFGCQVARRLHLKKMSGGNLNLTNFRWFGGMYPHCGMYPNVWFFVIALSSVFFSFYVLSTQWMFWSMPFTSKASGTTSLTRANRGD